jgi:hypothetical protein
MYVYSGGGGVEGKVERERTGTDYYETCGRGEGGGETVDTLLGKPTSGEKDYGEMRVMGS